MEPYASPFNDLPIKWILAIAVSIGYILGSLSVPISWLLLFIIAIYQTMKHMFGMAMIDDPFYTAMHDGDQMDGLSAETVHLNTRRSTLSSPNSSYSSGIGSGSGSGSGTSTFAASASQGSSSRNRQQKSKNGAPAILASVFSYGSTPSSTPMSSRIDGAIASCNAIIDTVWRNWHDQYEWLPWINTTIAQFNEYWGSLFTKIEITDLDIGNDQPPVIKAIKLSEASDARTVVEVEFEYNGAMQIEWRIVPKVLHLNVKCLVKDIVVAGTLRIGVEYSLDGKFKEINFSLTKYPHIDAKAHVFDSLDIRALSNTIPSLSATLKSRFKEYVQQLVFPNTFPFKFNKNPDEAKRDTISTLRFELSRMDKENMESEISKMMLNINQLLNTKLPNSTDTHQRDLVKREVCESVIQVLKYGAQPSNTTPNNIVSRDGHSRQTFCDSSESATNGIGTAGLAETIKRGFQIVNSLAFDGNAKKGLVCYPVIEYLLRHDNLTFIGSVVRSGPLADDLILNIMRTKDVHIRKMINRAFADVNMQDVPLLAVNRLPPKR